jgi:hypothetical protein
MCVLCFLLLAAFKVQAQQTAPECLPGDKQKDTVSKKGTKADSTTRKGWMHNIFQQAWSSIQKEPGDTSVQHTVLNTKSEDEYICLAGKTIRRISCAQYGFDRNFIDTSRRITSFAARAARTLHSNTKNWVIESNLFFRENQPLDPYIIADNERYLRTLDFLQDARILVLSVAGSEDSVDVMVVTKDLFSIKVDFDNNGITAGKLRVREDNFLGMGQQLAGAILYDPARKSMGYDLQYSKNNIGGTFIHGVVAYSNTNSGHNIGLENEESYYIRMFRPLPSPYFRIAGGLEAITSHSVNVFGRGDSLFTKYRYNYFDVWAGYNLFLGDILAGDNHNRERKFLSLRYMHQDFKDLPQHFRDNYDFIYNSKQAVLGQLTFFKQDFVKTQYIYGFGITEDVPYGYNASFTGGFWQQRDLRRPYAGVNIDYYTARAEGAFCQYYLKTGAFFHQHQLQDASVLIGLSYFSKLFFTGNTKIRQYVRATFTQLFNRVTYEPLRIDNTYGLRDFGTDTLYGNQRASIQSETNIFTNFKFHGIKFAPFLYADLAMLRGDGLNLNKADVFTGLGGGIRARNENVIFGTVELKAVYFPRVTPGGTTFRISLNSDIRFRYNSNYITPPDIARLNYL